MTVFGFKVVKSQNTVQNCVRENVIFGLSGFLFLNCFSLTVICHINLPVINLAQDYYALLLSSWEVGEVECQSSIWKVLSLPPPVATPQ